MTYDKNKKYQPYIKVMMSAYICKIYSTQSGNQKLSVLIRGTDENDKWETDEPIWGYVYVTNKTNMIGNVSLKEREKISIEGNIIIKKKNGKYSVDIFATELHPFESFKSNNYTPQQTKQEADNGEYPPDDGIPF